MKYQIMFALLMAGFALAQDPAPPVAQDAAPAAPDKFRTGLEPYAGMAYITEDFDSANDQLGVIVGSDYWFTENIGIYADALSLDHDHTLVDRASGGLKLRAPIGTSPFAVGTEIGYGYEFERQEQSSNAGAFVEGRWNRAVLRLGGRVEADVEDFGSNSRFVFPVTLGFNF